MLRLAVTTDAETRDRMADPLADRDIAVEYLPCSARQFRLTGADRPAADRFDAGFVFPGRLMEGGVVDALYGIPWLNDRQTVLRSRNKAAVIARLDAAGLPVPETVLVSNPADETTLEAAFEAVGTPAILKPNSTTRGTGVLRIDDYDSFRSAVDYLKLVHDFNATGDKSFLLQEFLPAARDVRVMVIEGTYVGAVERRLSTAAREAGRYVTNVHRGATAEAITPAPRIRALAERAASELDFAFAGIDLLVTEDRAVVSETNVRPTIDAADKYVDDFYDRLATAIRGCVES